MRNTMVISMMDAAGPRIDPVVRALRWIMVIGVLLLFFVVVPILNLNDIMQNNILNRLGRYLALAVVALGIDLIWGYTGVLSLCQAFFFCLGGYVMAMFLALPAGHGDVRPEYHNIPQFLFFNNWNTLPAFWQPFNMPFPIGIGLTLIMVIVLPAVVSGVLGFFIFRSRVRGVYFSIVTQAIAWGVWLLFCRNEMLLGGTNGLTNFYKPLTQERKWILGLYLLTLAVLVLAYLFCRLIVKSRLGRVLVAIRDKETRLYFAGYRPYAFKVFAFSAGAVLAGVGGMLYVPQTGIITPNNMTVPESIGFVIWVALGGRGRLWGAVLGSLIVNFINSAMTSDLPSTWLFVQGGMFLLVVLLLPEGFVGLWDKLEEKISRRARIFSIAITAVPFATVIAFVLTEAIGLVPDCMQKVLFTVQGVGDIKVKYVLVIVILIASAVAGYVQRWKGQAATPESEPDPLPIVSAKEQA